MRVDGTFLAVNGKSNFVGPFTAVTQHDGTFLAVDGFPVVDGNVLAVEGNSNFDGKTPLYRDRPPVLYFYVGKFTEHLLGKNDFNENRLPCCAATNSSPQRGTKLDSQLTTHNFRSLFSVFSNIILIIDFFPSCGTRNISYSSSNGLQSSVDRSTGLQQWSVSSTGLCL